MVNIPDAAVQAVMDAWNADCPIPTHDEIIEMLTAALPHLPHGCGDSKPIELLECESLQRKISEIGNQIHNLSCEYQNDDNLRSRLSGLSIDLWEISKRVSPMVDVAAVRRQAFEDAIQECAEIADKNNAFSTYDAILALSAEITQKD